MNILSTVAIDQNLEKKQQQQREQQPKQQQPQQQRPRPQQVIPSWTIGPSLFIGPSGHHEPMGLSDGPLI